MFMSACHSLQSLQMSEENLALLKAQPGNLQHQHPPGVYQNASLQDSLQTFPTLCPPVYPFHLVSCIQVTFVGNSFKSQDITYHVLTQARKLSAPERFPHQSGPGVTNSRVQPNPQVWKHILVL